MSARNTITDFRNGARSVSHAAAKVRGDRPVRVVFQAVATWWHFVDLGLVPLEFLLAAREMCGAMKETP